MILLKQSKLWKRGPKTLTYVTGGTVTTVMLKILLQGLYWHIFNKLYCQVRSSKAPRLCEVGGFSVKETLTICHFFGIALRAKRKEEVSEHSLSLISVVSLLSLTCCLEQPVGCTAYFSTRMESLWRKRVLTPFCGNVLHHLLFAWWS